MRWAQFCWRTLHIQSCLKENCRSKVLSTYNILLGPTYVVEIGKMSRGTFSSAESSNLRHESTGPIKIETVATFIAAPPKEDWNDLPNDVPYSRRNGHVALWRKMKLPYLIENGHHATTTWGRRSDLCDFTIYVSGKIRQLFVDKSAGPKAGRVTKQTVEKWACGSTWWPNGSLKPCM